MATVEVGDCAEDGKAVQTQMPPRRPGLEVGVAGGLEGGEECVERRALQREHRVAIEQRCRVQSVTGLGQRPSEVPAAEGSRFYDAAGWSLGNTSPTKAFQTFLYPLDNTPAMDFLLPGAKNGGGGKAGISSGCDDNSLLVTGPAVARAGGTVEYTITSSSGAKPDDGCRVNDVLPGDVTFVSASNGGVYDAATHTVAWSTGTAPAATVTSLKLTGQVASGAALGSVLVDEASFDGLIFGPFARAETTVVP